jgi:hypothetical protein
MARKRTSEKELVVSPSMAAPARRKTTSSPHKKHTATQSETPMEPVATAVVPVEPVAEPLSEPKAAAPSQEEIAALAYSYWEARGCQGGSPEEDWLRAEQEVRAKAGLALA